jgi:putative peptidoglycan binding protein
MLPRLLMALTPYVVRQGDYLTKLAHRFGFDADEVWNAKENEPLRKKGRSPDLLCSGDVLYLPQPKKPWRSVNVGSVNNFVAKVPLIKVHARFATADKPWAGEAYNVQGADLPAGTLDGDGNFNAEVPIHVSAVVLEFTKRKTRFTLRVGHLDPITEDSGVEQRLAHLGFLPRRSIAGSAHEQALLSRAIASFQTANGLSVTGVADDDTRAKIVSAHGS